MWLLNQKIPRRTKKDYRKGRCYVWPQYAVKEVNLLLKSGKGHKEAIEIVLQLNPSASRRRAARLRDRRSYHIIRMGAQCPLMPS